MSENDGLFGRVGRWFKRRFTSQDDLPLLHGETETSTAIVKRPFLGFGWQRREEDLSALQTGLASMTALMGSLRQYLDQQNARHDELLTYLSQLSHALQSIPDSGRIQGETLRVLHQQIAYQNAQHKQLSDMIRRISESTGTQQEIVEFVRERVEALYKNDEEISQTIGGMGGSISVVSQQSQTNTLVLERLRDNLVSRDGDLEKAVRKENQLTRGALMIVGATSLVALVISVGIALYSWSAISRVADSVSQPRQNSSKVEQPAPKTEPTPKTESPAPQQPVSVTPATQPVTPVFAPAPNVIPTTTPTTVPAP